MGTPPGTAIGPRALPQSLSKPRGAAAATSRAFGTPGAAVTKQRLHPAQRVMERSPPAWPLCPRGMRSPG